MRFWNLFKKYNVKNQKRNDFIDNIDERKNRKPTEKLDNLTLDTDINIAIDRINRWAEGGEDKELDDYLKNMDNPNYDNFPILTGVTSNSNNKLYSIMVCDRQHYYVVYENGNRKFKGKLERPNYGKIADNGIFIIEDWMNNEEKCCGTFYAFNFKNEILIKQKINANIFNSGISDDGKFACVQTAHTKPMDNNDANKLYFFDLQNKILLWKKTLPSGWANSYTIDTITSILTLHYHNTSIDYDFDGNMKDLNKWSKQRLNVLEPYEIKSIAEDLIKTHANEIYIYENEILELLTAAESKDVSNYQLAQCYRWLGEAFININNVAKTITYFKKALDLYPNIGVKRLYSKLKSE